MNSYHQFTGLTSGAVVSDEENASLKLESQDTLRQVLSELFGDEK